MNSIEEVLKYHGLENINEAIDLMIDSPEASPRKPQCRKCKKDVEISNVFQCFNTNTYYFEASCHGKSESVQGYMPDIYILSDYIFEG